MSETGVISEKEPRYQHEILCLALVQNQVKLNAKNLKQQS
jgi:hypothetical protein